MGLEKRIWVSESASPFPELAEWGDFLSHVARVEDFSSARDCIYEVVGATVTVWLYHFVSKAFVQICSQIPLPLNAVCLTFCGRLSAYRQVSRDSWSCLFCVIRNRWSLSTHNTPACYNKINVLYYALWCPPCSYHITCASNGCISNTRADAIYSSLGFICLEEVNNEKNIVKVFLKNPHLI